jgi:nicotinamide riboside transporter PnuC
MSKATNQENMQSTVNQFTLITNALYDNHAYSSGYYESTILMLFAELPAKKQEMYLGMMQNTLSTKTNNLINQNKRKVIQQKLRKNNI